MLISQITNFFRRFSIISTKNKSEGWNFCNYKNFNGFFFIIIHLAFEKKRIILGIYEIRSKENKCKLAVTAKLRVSRRNKIIDTELPGDKLIKKFYSKCSGKNNDNVRSMIFFDTDIIIPVLSAVARWEEPAHCVAYSCFLFSLLVASSVTTTCAHLVFLIAKPFFRLCKIVSFFSCFLIHALVNAYFECN